MGIELMAFYAGVTASVLGIMTVFGVFAAVIFMEFGYWLGKATWNRIQIPRERFERSSISASDVSVSASR